MQDFLRQEIAAPLAVSTPPGAPAAGICRVETGGCLMLPVTYWLRAYLDYQAVQTMGSTSLGVLDRGPDLKSCEKCRKLALKKHFEARL